VFYAQTLPRTASGKLDRAQVKELAMMEIGRQNAGRSAAAAG